MPLNSPSNPRSPGGAGLTRRARAAGAGPALAVRAARASVDRMRRVVNLAVRRSPQSLFLRELVAQPGTVGAICASSPRLAARMASWVDPAAPGLVVELGGGTGVITAALLARGVAPERLVVIEQSAALAAHLRRRFVRVRVVHGDAAELASLAQSPDWPRDGAGAPLPIGCIVSGLPLLSIPPAVRQRILQAGAALLAPGGRLLQFTYAMRGPSLWQAAGLVGQARERVLANLPPARIDVLGHAGHG
ncbi:class I SAM-dependent methyltransferase [Ottowia testudinis]|uniref:Methyltransferase domain-containing protein n=1 Tax=Ottowia testudinis TaxID=2816950 RepID=A0A975H313_9BURK|nr:methyltransferase domain-containing protein [Ottowia testudinis]QTD45423.1 methyltransferase domain-containing protein [Ottowia testudinis]